MTTPAPHAWFEPKLVALMAEAQQAGIARDVSVAVITDLVNGKLSAAVPAPQQTNPDQDIGEPDYMVNQGPYTTPDAAAASNPIANPLDHVGIRRGRH